MTPSVTVAEPDDLDPSAILAIAGGATPELTPSLVEQVHARREQVLAALRSAGPVYGVSTGMGAQSRVALSAEEQALHSARLMIGRAVGGPPWLDQREVRALIACRLRGFLNGDAGVSPELVCWLQRLLVDDVRLQVPRSGYAAAGEIIPLAHAWLHLSPEHGLPLAPTPPSLGPKEGVALLQGVPILTGLSLLRAAEVTALQHQWLTVISAELQLTGASRDPYRPATARGDDVLTAVLAEFAGLEPNADELDVGAPRSLQAPVSFRVGGQVLTHLRRATAVLDQAVLRALIGVGDSPAYLNTEPATDAAVGTSDLAGTAGFVGTAGFHGLDLAAACEGLRIAVLHAAEVGVARLHRLMDSRLTGLPAQLSPEPGPQAGLIAVHKRVAGMVRVAASRSSALLNATETSLGQEDVQTAGLDVAEALREAVHAARHVLAAELLAVHQAQVLDPDRPLSATLRSRLRPLTVDLPADPADRPYGAELDTLVARL